MGTELRTVSDLHAELKGLRSEIETIKSQVRALNHKKTVLNNQAQAIEVKLNEIGLHNIPITASALVRYMETEMGLDANKVRDIIRDEVRSGHSSAKRVEFNGFIIKDGTVVNYLKPQVDLSQASDHSQSQPSE